MSIIAQHLKNTHRYMLSISMVVNISCPWSAKIVAIMTDRSHIIESVGREFDLDHTKNYASDSHNAKVGEEAPAA